MCGSFACMLLVKLKLFNRVMHNCDPNLLRIRGQSKLNRPRVRQPAHARVTNAQHVTTAIMSPMPARHILQRASRRCLQHANHASLPVGAETQFPFRS
jgi:hypothetical protein